MKHRKGEYNGHKNWNFWNVALWLNNDEYLHDLVKMAVKIKRTRDEQVEYLMRHLPSETPDGAKYRKTYVKAALKGL